MHLNSKNILLVGIILTFLAIVGGNVYAQSISLTSRSDWKADDSLINNIPSYTQVKTIEIEDITSKDPTLATSTNAYVRGLYYYLGAEYGLDLPFTYLVGWDGNIYEGAKSGIGATVQKTADGSVIIGYLDNGDGITSNATTSFSYLLAKLAKQTGVGLDNISSASYIFDNGGFILSDTNPSWDDQVSTLKTALKGQVPDKTGSVNDVVGIKSVGVEPSKDGNLNVTIKAINKGDATIYGRIYAGTDKASGISIPNIWISNLRSNAATVSNIQNGDTFSVTFEILGKAAKGQYSLDLYTDTSKISGGTFVVTYADANSFAAITTPIVTPTPSVTNTPTTTGLQVTISNTGLGYLNVHDSPSISAKIIAKVNTGATFSVQNTATNTSGKWYQILYDGTNSGWISAQYTH